MRTPRRSHSAEFKAEFVLLPLRDDKTIGDLAEQLDVHVNQITERKNRPFKQSERFFLKTAEWRAVDWDHRSGTAIAILQISADNQLNRPTGAR